MSVFTILHGGRESPEPFANYVFHVMRNGEHVAEISHDYRGDEHWIRKPHAQWEDLPERIILGGGPQPLELTDAGVKTIEALLGRKS